MDKAVQVYRDRLQTVGKNAEFFNQYAWWVYENKVASEYTSAMNYVEQALALKPDAFYIWDTLAWLYFESGEQQKAVEASTRALSLAPENQRKAYQEALDKIKKGR